METTRIPTIRSSLVLLVLACIIPGSLMVGALIWHNYHQDRGDVTQASMETARAMVAAVDRELGGIQAALLTLGTSPSLTSDDLSGFYGQAREMVKTLTVDNIVLIDPAFRQRMNTARPFGS